MSMKAAIPIVVLSSFVFPACDFDASRSRPRPRVGGFAMRGAARFRSYMGLTRAAGTSSAAGLASQPSCALDYMLCQDDH
jgi:hypothetical protein